MPPTVISYVESFQSFHGLSSRVRRWVTVPVLLFVLHIILTFMVAWWSFILAMPWPTFPTSKAYTAFIAISADERYWATGFAFTALIGVFGAWAARPWHRHPRDWVARGLSACMLGINHGIIAVLTYRGSPSSTGTGIYFFIMVLAYILAAAEACHDDE